MSGARRELAGMLAGWAAGLIVGAGLAETVVFLLDLDPTVGLLVGMVCGAGGSIVGMVAGVGLVDRADR